MSRKIDLNCDMGEGLGTYQVSYDEEIIKFVSSVNVACGFHGGAPDVMDKTVKMAKQYDVSVGAHPGYPDLLGFGRWDMNIPRDTLKNIIVYQIGALDIFCQKYDVKMKHVKPHGSLNNQADFDQDIAETIVEAVQSIDLALPLFVKPNSQLEKAARAKGQPVVLELYADRAYHNNMSLVSRQEEGAVITDPKEVVKNVLQMVNDKKIVSITGEEINIEGESVCVHGDTPTALKMVKKLKNALIFEGIKITPPK